ncbi:MAG: NADH oxidase [Candidatus Poribacteria bacterium]|nr:MAG: NADH oxidase [Candidatus Poribacteria bacterium]
MRLVVIGGDAAGMSAASKAKREAPEVEVVVLERSDYVSYAACGLPYLLEGVVEAPERLIARTAEQHRARGIDVRLRHEAIGIDVRRRVVTARTPEGERDFSYDKLVLATGARPRRPAFAQAQLEGVFVLRSIPDALQIQEYLERFRPRRALLVGGGYIGMEMAEALRVRGLEVTLLEHGPQILKSLDPEVAGLVAEVLSEHGVRILYEREVVELIGTSRVQAARLADGVLIECDLVVVGAGAVPNSELAREAGIALGEKGAIRVDPAQRTSAFHVFAAGDCAEARHVVLNRNVYIPLGTTANKQGRVAGENAVGGFAQFGGVAGTMVCKVFDRAFARTGLSDAQAAQNGFIPKSALIEAEAWAHYYGKPPTIAVKLTYDERTRRLLGGQLVGDASVAKRVDVVAAALHAGMTIDQFAQLDLSYAPPFAPVWDPLLVAANVARGQ